MQVARHKTAIRRTDLSRPIRLALEESLVTEGTTVFDFGCGHGSDIRLLRRRGVDAAGWDPNHRPKARKVPAQVVNLGYVVNVIEDARERAQVLRDAWGLASRLLIVSARLDIDVRGALPGSSFADGQLTGLGTFQKFYKQSELREWVDKTLRVRSAALAPGIMLVFRDEAEREEFVASRFRRRSGPPRLSVSDEVFQAHQALLEPIMQFVQAHGRLPVDEEFPAVAELKEKVGSIKQAFAVIRRVTGKEVWEEFRRERARDGLVYLALRCVPRPPKFSSLHPSLQRDVRALFGTYKRAVTDAQQLLFLAGDTGAVRKAAGASQVGKRMPEAIYVHRTALELLPPLLRVYEGCARMLLGDVQNATLIKLALGKPKVSYLHYSDFDKHPHPELRSSTLVYLDNLRVFRRRYDVSANPPILHRKEEFVADDYPGREKFARLSKQEDDWALFTSPSDIGTRDGWLGVLQRTGVELKGHRLVRRKD